jgi:hypothetical protein
VVLKVVYARMPRLNPCRSVRNLQPIYTAAICKTSLWLVVWLQPAPVAKGVNRDHYIENAVEDTKGRDSDGACVCLCGELIGLIGITGRCPMHRGMVTEAA